ncbi:MAG: BtpA/SgcQ family protein [Candidatus Poribacteria bacterium]|nr:BtpA/SgcQ family protein [Candidatus Poribacteria bacterium]
MQGINCVFSRAKPIVGVVHLLPLLGSPRQASPLNEVRARALADAEALIDNGIDAVIVENYGDAPFFPDCVEAHTVAVMAIIVNEHRERFPKIPIGVNVLRNDAKSALAIAAAANADFIRINVHTGAMLTDQGVLQGKAYETVRYRSFLGSNVKIFADVAVKHAAPIGQFDLASVAQDTYHRGLADALIVTGAGTGERTELKQLKTVKDAVPHGKVFAGSGVAADYLAETLQCADGVIVGTSIKRDGVTTNEVDPVRVRALIDARGS